MMRAVSKTTKALTFAALVVGIFVVGATTSRYQFGVNLSESLSDWGYLVDTENTAPARGDYVQFFPVRNRFYPSNTPFVKRVAGVPGDEVRLVGRDVFVAGHLVGRAKPFARDGRPLTPTAQGIIPAGRYFVVGDHVDSYDSRYADIGWVGRDRIRGVARPVM
jgi:conjugal transfer pilin signal peptidase TrbI